MNPTTTQIPTFASVREDAVWAAAFVRHLTGGSREAWRHADIAVERLRDEAQRRAVDEGQVANG